MSGIVERLMGSYIPLPWEPRTAREFFELEQARRDGAEMGKRAAEVFRQALSKEGE